jgi:hypothetical protein
VVSQIRPVAAICEISLSGLSNRLKRLLIQRHSFLSSLDEGEMAADILEEAFVTKAAVSGMQ